MAEILSLAYYGDAVIEILVREYLVTKYDFPPKELVKKSKDFITCEAQSNAYENIAQILTQEEEAVFRRGRNAKTHSAPKHGQLIQYKRATGFEALFGHLFLTGQKERANQLFSVAYRDLLQI